MFNQGDISTFLLIKPYIYQEEEKKKLKCGKN